jgi:hypothetical protein
MSGIHPSVKQLFQTLALAALGSGALTGCAENWSETKVTHAHASTAVTSPTAAKDIRLTEGDITDRQYTSLGDLAVTVNKLTVFNDDPTREQVDAKLKAEAAKLGADAVILVRYGAVGISAVSWGSLDGKGRAIKFAP